LQGYRNILQLLNDVLLNWDGDAMILLENQAGRGEYLGSTLEEIVQIRKLCVKPDKIGFCFDTCHAYASGLWKPGQWMELERKGIELGYFNHLMVIHLNDSMYPSESYRDRHAQIGQGFIGEKQFIAFLQSPVIRFKPIILETPDAKSHAKEIAYVKQLMTTN
jgi:deoxyribonuclease-4